MYKIIGTDGQQYGPVGVDQIRQWIAEKRANAHTLAQSDGSSDWRPLLSFSEFASSFQGAPPLTSTPGSNPRASTKIPAGIFGILLGGLGIHKFILGYTGAGLTMLLISVLSCGFLYPIMHLIGLIEGIIYLCKSDDHFVQIYVDGRQPWF